jgi:ABC-type Na+ efflux pump permease subunit
MSEQVVAVLVRQAQLFAVVTGLALLAIANRLYEIARLDLPSYFFPGLWPYWFVVAGMLTLGWSLRPDSRCLLILSGAFTVSAMVSRAVGTVLQLTEAGTMLTSPQLHVAGLVWTGLAVSLAYLWTTDFKTATHLTRRSCDGRTS